MNVDNLFDPDSSKPSAGAPVEPYKWLIIDGGGLAVTAWATHKNLDRPEDRVKAAVYVFVTCIASLSRLISNEAKIIVVWDGADNRKWRRGRHPWYKHGRGSVINRNEVRAAITKLHELMMCIGVAEVKVDGREADDLVATIANEIDSAINAPVLIFSDDKDYIQLIDANIHLCRRSLQGIIMTPEQCELMGIPFGIDYLHIKALMGDPGDNIRGLDGIGEKKATDLINALPDFMETALMDPELIDWSSVGDKLKRAFYRAGRNLVWPPVMDDPAFGAKIAAKRGIKKPEEVDVDEAAALKAAAQVAVKCLDLVELDRAAEHPSIVFPEINVERIPVVLRSLDMQDETDLLSSLYSIARMRSRNGATPRTSAVRAGMSIREGSIDGSEDF
jgi:5'-3' exonuclease